MPVYEYGGERVDAVQWSKFDDHPYTRQLKPGEFTKELPEVPSPRAQCAALDQPGEEPLLVRPGDMIVSRQAEHGELRCEVVPAEEFLGKAKFVGVRDPEMSAGMSASPEHAERRAKRIDDDLTRQVERREKREQEIEQRRQEAERNPERPEPPPKQTTGQPGSPQAAVLGRRGEDGTLHDRSHRAEKEATPQPAGADGNRGTKADEPDPDAARSHKAKAR